MTLAADLFAAATAQNVVIATAESCTGGLIAGAITDVPGSSAIFDRGFVTYSNAAKRDMLGVTQQALDGFGAVSQEVAEQMALGAVDRSDAQLALSVTGIAGPGGSEHKPEGRVCFALARDGVTHSETVEFGALGRDAVRAAAVTYGLNLLLRALSNKKA